MMDVMDVMGLDYRGRKTISKENCIKVEGYPRHKPKGKGRI
jgi:hypothetical protein